MLWENCPCFACLIQIGLLLLHVVEKLDFCLLFQLAGLFLSSISLNGRSTCQFLRSSEQFSLYSTIFKIAAAFQTAYVQLYTA